MDGDTLPPFQLEPVDNAATRWEKWIRRFDNFLVAKAIESDQRQKAVLLHLAGEEVFDLSENIGVTDKDDFEDTKQKLHNYFAPKRNIEYKVFVFRQATQQHSESLDKFNARLTSLSKYCNFTERERAIKSQIIQKCLNEKFTVTVDMETYNSIVFKKDKTLLQQMYESYESFKKANGGSKAAETLMTDPTTSKTNGSITSDPSKSKSNVSITSDPKTTSASSITSDPKTSTSSKSAERIDSECHNSSWTKAETLRLIDLYGQNIENVNNGTMRKITLWKRIAEQFTTFTSEQCRGRWKTLTSGYKKVKDKKKKSGNGHIHDFEYEKELDILFGDSYANINPITLSSMEDNPILDDSVRSVDSEIDESSNGSNSGKKLKLNASELELTETSKKQRKYTSSASEVISYLEKLNQKDEDRRREERELAEKMHNDKMQLLNPSSYSLHQQSI